MYYRAIKYVGIAIVAAVLWYFAIKPVAAHFFGFDEITWRAQTFKLKQSYLDYDDYKYATDPLAPSEVERVKQFMCAIKVPATTSSDQELILGLTQMTFPGFGHSSHGSVKDERGNRYILDEYVIPQKHELRSLLYSVAQDRTCHLVLDGVSVDHENDHILLGIPEVRVENGKLKHLLNGKVYREISLDPPKEAK